MAQRNLTTLIVSAYCLFHIASAIIPLRYWPVTDYPMFAETDNGKTPMILYRFYGTNDRGISHKLERGFAFGYGSGEYNLIPLIERGETDRLRTLIQKAFQKNGLIKKYTSFVVKKVRVDRPTWDNPVLVITEDEILRLHL